MKIKMQYHQNMKLKKTVITYFYSIHPSRMGQSEFPIGFGSLLVCRWLAGLKWLMMSWIWDELMGVCHCPKKIIFFPYFNRPIVVVAIIGEQVGDHNQSRQLNAVQVPDEIMIHFFWDCGRDKRLLQLLVQVDRGLIGAICISPFVLKIPTGVT